MVIRKTKIRLKHSTNQESGRFTECMESPIIDIIISVSSKELKLNYQCETSQVNYSISDLAGNIIQNGNYDCLIDSTVPIHDLSAGMYELIIIDGDKFCKTRFRKS